MRAIVRPAEGIIKVNPDPELTAEKRGPPPPLRLQPHGTPRGKL